MQPKSLYRPRLRNPKRGATGSRVVEFLRLLITGVSLIVIVDAISSWFIRDDKTFPRNLTVPLTDPLYRPVHLLLNPERTGGIDFAPMVVLFLLQAIGSALKNAAGA